VRFPIAFDAWYRVLSTVLALPPSTAYVEIAGDEIDARMGWAFRARFPRSAVASASPDDMEPLSRGVHGFGGRWLVNGAGRGIVSVRLDPPQRAYVLGFPIRLRELLVSVHDASGLVAALGGSRSR
jgi:hypothetical protein